MIRSESSWPARFAATWQQIRGWTFYHGSIWNWTRHVAVFKMPCSSVFLQWPLKLPFNHHSIKIWGEKMAGQLFPNRKLLSSAWLLFCWPGNRICFPSLCLLIGSQSLKFLCKSVQKSLAPEEATSTATPLSWPKPVWNYSLLAPQSTCLLFVSFIQILFQKSIHKKNGKMESKQNWPTLFVELMIFEHSLIYHNG